MPRIDQRACKYCTCELLNWEAAKGERCGQRVENRPRSDKI